MVADMMACCDAILFSAASFKQIIAESQAGLLGKAAADWDSESRSLTGPSVL